MSSKSGPIVITLKKSHGSKDDAVARSRSRSVRAKPKERAASLSPLREPMAPSILNVTALEDIFARFHGELDTWLQRESRKLERAERRGSGARDALGRSGTLVCDFLRDYAPRTYQELGAEPQGEAFTTRALPQFLEMVEEDQRALQEATAVLGAFAERRFPKNKELALLKNDSSPLPLMRAILRLLAA
uniref:Uncharacterized protein n=1 Tax=Noctiluca scintillans TaxID=2966 RepID=A0A7S0ZRS8_NOCSC|mmetsp:Transcript_15726/g.42872  ORF Transcript_15726/g.42872 Transcript_15726/m.42872 type:complete len:189 (+) Transcript_15726:69-635(+)|eukprot:CAMPEP_0194548692 /NCGR_PEP_ID=MMETSP0253-20130528/94018_1 /TAXON_ID=2966 /ORGANISM="Noctiluca scintillans" /LENGTH=188 /DNA_ID=CAMNT_0039396027 /DNA_START=65 /DNA_END=631 /DNA_ORIENTATION=+